MSGDGNNPRELFRRFSETRDPKRRRELGRKISETNPESAFDLVTRGLLEAEDNAGDMARAIADYTRAIEKDPTLSEAYLARAKALAALKDYDRAIEDLTRAISLNPTSPDAYQHRGNLYARMDDLKSAMHDFSRAKELAVRQV